MEFEKLTAQVRAGRKKGVARKLRQSGMIPAVCYGPKMSPLALSVDPKSLSEAFEGPLGRNAVIEMTVEGEGAPDDGLLVMLQDYQYHPVIREVIHADFLRVFLGHEISIEVPFELVGKSAGVQAGGIVSQVFRKLPVRCKPKDIPVKISIDISAMELGDIRKVSDLTLPEGVEVDFEPNQTLVSVTAPTAAAAGEGEAEEDEGEELAEAAAESTE